MYREKTVVRSKIEWSEGQTLFKPTSEHLINSKGAKNIEFVVKLFNN